MEMKRISLYLIITVIGLCLAGCASASSKSGSYTIMTFEEVISIFEQSIGLTPAEVEKLIGLKLDNPAKGSYVALNFPKKGDFTIFYTEEDSGKVWDCKVHDLSAEFSTVVEALTGIFGEPSATGRNGRNWESYKPGVVGYIYINEIQGGGTFLDWGIAILK
jgi:hypothetical protein